MKKISILFIVSLFLNSCNSLKLKTQEQINETKNIKRFNFSDFSVYSFNICEAYESKDYIERFIDCPEDFYDVAASENLRKVEELYLLKHRETDLVLYLTTVSHKYFRKNQTGFLNDPKYYKGTIVLDEIESIYIGRYDSETHIVHFPSYKDEKDIILHFDPNAYPETLWLKRANIATAENDYDISDPIQVDSVFKQALKYRLKANYDMHYYGSRKKDMTKRKLVDRIFITSTKGEVQVNFGFNNFDEYYQMRDTHVKYHPNFFLIQEH